MNRRKAIYRATGGVASVLGGGAMWGCGEPLHDVSPENGKKEEDSSVPYGTQSTRAVPIFAGEIGITTGGFDSQRESGELTLENLPRILNSELGMSLIDVNTRWFRSYDQSYVEACRELAAANGCEYSNLKVNHRFGDLYAADPEETAAATNEAKRMIDVAHWLGARWIRFTLPQAPTLSGDLSKHRELALYGLEKSVRLVVENGGWMRSQADSISLGVKAIGRLSESEMGRSDNQTSDFAAGAPDTGNWDDEVRQAGLALSFPGAVTCDFKVFDLNPDGKHEKYDIQQCFDIGWRAGYRGPWLIEHWNVDTSALLRELLLLRDQLRQWTRIRKIAENEQGTQR